MKFKNTIFSNTEELEKELNYFILQLKINGMKIDKSKFIRLAIQEKIKEWEKTYERVIK